MTAGPYESVLQELQGNVFASIAYVEETHSTNADAAPLLRDERYGGHTIVAEYQRHGAGRKGRVWVAPAGTALLCTTILPRSVASENLWIVSYWVALAVRAALLEFGVRATLQWPNDLLLRNLKLAGVLCQSSVSAESARVACGVGINVHRPGADSGIDPPPAYCDDLSPVERPRLLHAILRQYERRLFMLDQPLRVATDWEEAAGLPRPYRIAPDVARAPFEAIAQGLEPGGNLRVRRLDGREEHVSLADVRVLR